MNMTNEASTFDATEVSMMGKYLLDTETLLALISVFVDYCKDHLKMDYTTTKKEVENVIAKLDAGKEVVMNTIMPRAASVLNNKFKLAHYPDVLASRLLENILNTSLENHLTNDMLVRALRELKELEEKKFQAKNAVLRDIIGTTVSQCGKRFKDYFPDDFLRALASDNDIDS